MREQPWRVGRHVGRTVYRTRDDGGDDELIGLMDTPELAQLVVDAVNAAQGAMTVDIGMPPRQEA
jgi:hypothetical protein